MNNSFMSEDRSRPIYVHIHVPKSAGSMLNSILAKNIGDQLGRDNPLLSYRKYTQDEMQNLFFLYPYLCFTGHVYSLNALPLDTHPNIRAFSFVRDPVEKTISAYNYIRQRHATMASHPARHLELHELVGLLQREQTFHPFMLDCSQVDWITGAGMGSLEAIRQFMERGVYHCYPTDRFDEACVVLEKALPDLFVDCAYPQRINVSTSDTVDDATRELIRNLPWVAEDNALVALAGQHLDSQIESHFRGEGVFRDALKAFRLRCEALRANNASLRRKPRNVWSRLSSSFGASRSA
jgi:hypothetical protein